MISEEDVEKAVSYLRSSAEGAAKARAERVYIEEARKSVLATIMKKYADMPVNAQEREAMADPEYKTHLEAIREAVYADEKFRLMRAAAEARIDAWRSLNANYRAIKV